MTQKQIEQIKQTRVIAEKDGWKIDRSLAYRGMGAIPTHSLNYLTDLNALHSVVKQIRSEFRENHPPLDNAVEIYKQLGNAIYDAFDSDSYEDLFNAVYDAIVFLNENKQNKL